MGDTRYHEARERVERALREGQMARVSADTAVQALADMAAEADPLRANVLATRVLNQLRRSATLLRFVADGVVALDGEGRVLFANPAAEQMLAWEAEGLLGRDFHETVHHQKRDGSDVPRQRCELLNALERSASEDAVRVSDHDVFERRDGTTFMAGFVAAPIVHAGESVGAAVVFRDITVEKENEATLALHRVALDAVPLPVFWLGRDGAILYANPAAADRLGYARDELTRMRVFDFDTDVRPDAWRDQWARVKAAGSVEFRSHHRTRGGDVHPVLIRAQHVQHDDQEFHVALALPTT